MTCNARIFVIICMRSFIIIINIIIIIIIIVVIIKLNWQVITNL